MLGLSSAAKGITMAIGKRICGRRAASLLGAALTGLMIAGGSHARAADYGCQLANNEGLDGTAFSNFSGQYMSYKRFAQFAPGDAITITLAPNTTDNPLAFSYYSFYALGVTDIIVSGINCGNQQQIKLFPTGNGVTGGTVDLSDPAKALGQDVAVLWSCISSQPPPPVVSSVTPNTGPFSGGTSVGITGTGFTGATAVQFGDINATAFSVNSDTSITAISPGGPGTVDVVVTGPRGASFIRVVDRFTYSSSMTPVPTITSMTSNVGYAGTEITINGTNFLTGVTNVQFGSISIPKGFLVTNATSIVAFSPAGRGTVDVTVTNSGGTSPSSTVDQFTYSIANTHDINGDNNSDILWYAVAETWKPFMNHMARSPAPSRQSRSALPSPLKSR